MIYFLLYLAIYYFISKFFRNERGWYLKNKLFNWQYLWILDCGEPHIIRIKKQPDGCWYGKLQRRSVILNHQEEVYGGYNITKALHLTKKHKIIKKQNNVINLTNYKQNKVKL